MRKVDSGKKLKGIGERLRGVRGKTSIPKFAQINHVHKSTIVRYEKEESYPDAKFIIDFCNRFGINPNWLLTGEGPKQSQPAPLGFSAAMNELREKILFMKKNHVSSYRFYIQRIGMDADKAILTRQQLDDFIDGKFLPNNEELKTLCKMAGYEFELVKLERDPVSQGGEDELIQGIVGNKAPPANSEVLKEVLETIEKLSAELDINLPFDKKAELITLLYEEVVEDESKRNHLKERAERLVRLIV